MLILIILIDIDCIAYWFLSIGHAGYSNLYSVDEERGYRQCSTTGTHMYRETNVNE